MGARSWRRAGFWVLIIASFPFWLGWCIVDAIFLAIRWALGYKSQAEDDQ